MAVGCKIIRDFPRPARELVERFRGVATSNLVDVMGSCAAIDGALAPIGRGRLLGTAFPVLKISAGTHRAKLCNVTPL